MHKFGRSKEGERKDVTVPLAERLALSPQDASLLTGIGMTSIRTTVRSGALVARKHGKNTVILPDDLRAWLGTFPKAAKEAPAKKRVSIRNG